MLLQGFRRLRASSMSQNNVCACVCYAAVYVHVQYTHVAEKAKGVKLCVCVLYDDGREKGREREAKKECKSKKAQNIIRQSIGEKGPAYTE